MCTEVNLWKKSMSNKKSIMFVHFDDYVYEDNKI